LFKERGVSDSREVALVDCAGVPLQVGVWKDERTDVFKVLKRLREAGMMRMPFTVPRMLEVVEVRIEDEISRLSCLEISLLDDGFLFVNCASVGGSAEERT